MAKRKATDLPAVDANGEEVPDWVRSQEAFDRLPLVDPFFFAACFKDAKALSRLLSLVIGRPDIEVEKVEVERAFNAFDAHSARLDVYARDIACTVYDVELQNQNKKNEHRRAAFYLSALTADSMATGELYEELPDRYVVFLTAFDPFGLGRPTYHFEMAEKDGHRLDDGGHVVFFNTKYKGEDEAYASLASDLRATSHEQIKDAELARVMCYNKQGRRTRKAMIDHYEEQYRQIVERERKIGEEKKAEEVAKSLLSCDYPVEEVSKHTKLPLERIEELKKLL